MKGPILIVDDEEDIRNLISGILQDEGYKTYAARNIPEALEYLQKIPIALVLLDVWLGDTAYDGLDFLQNIKAQLPKLPVVIMSGHGTLEMAVCAIKRGACDFVEKPFKIEILLLVLERALEVMRLLEENTLLKAQSGIASLLAGASHAIRALHNSIARIAPTNSRVLIQGETGTGKEEVAQMLHLQSQRAKGPFLVLNCASLEPDDLHETLFGRSVSEGIFLNQGALEKAHGGTLVLDEVADMPLLTQSKILKTLQDQTLTREGVLPNIDVRIISTTRMNLKSLIGQGLFRSDLYYRLNVISLTVPPLRTRKEDILELTNNLMLQSAQNIGVAPRSFAFEVIAAFQKYHWPGNTRELKNIVERALILSSAPDEGEQQNKRPIGLNMLPAEVRRLADATFETKDVQDMTALPLKEARELFETQYLLAQIARFGGNISKTAHFVGMDRTALHRKLRHLNIGPDLS